MIKGRPSNREIIISTKEVKEWCPYKPDHLSLCYDEGKKKYYFFSEGKWVEDIQLNNTGRLTLGTIRKLGQYYYIYDGESQWVMFGKKEPTQGDMVRIRDNFYMYAGGKMEKIGGNCDRVTPNWDIFKKFYLDYILRHYMSWDVFYYAWLTKFPNNSLAGEGYRILEQHMGATAYIQFIKDGFDENLKKQVDNCAIGVGSDLDPLELDRILLSITEEKELAMLSGFCEGVGCIAKYVYPYSKELGEYLESHCHINDCSDCVKIFFDLVK